MTIEQEIAALLAKAEPLRALPDEEAESAGLPAIVECINKLRAMEAQAQMDNAEGEFAAIAESLQPSVIEYRKAADKLGIPEENRPSVTQRLEIDPDENDAVEAFSKPVRKPGRPKKVE